MVVQERDQCCFLLLRLLNRFPRICEPGGVSRIHQLLRTRFVHSGNGGICHSVPQVRQRGSAKSIPQRIREGPKRGIVRGLHEFPEFREIRGVFAPRDNDHALLGAHIAFHKAPE